MGQVSPFGAELQAQRRAAGLTLANLAAQVHYSSGQLSKIENGKAEASRILVERCEKVFAAGGALLAAFEGPHRIAAPCDLPRDTAAFVGRTGELNEILARFRSAAPTGTGIVTVCVVSGMGGVGKTALAVRAAHRLGEAFPDGRLFLDLHGFSAAAAVPPAEALSRLLRRLGVPLAELPAATDERAALLRDRLRGRRVLLVLDNVLDTAQLLPLLPGDGGCGVLVTSRDELIALEDAHPVRLTPLGTPQARELLTRLVAKAAPDGRSLPPSEIQGVAERCRGLPLLLRVTAARLRVEPWPQVLQPGNGTALADGAHDLAAVFESSVLRLPPETARMFTLLGLHPGADFDAAAVAAVTGTDSATARSGLRTLLETNLLLTTESPGRYAFHDLIKLFVRERARTALPPADRTASFDRLAAHYLAALDSADRVLTPRRHRSGMEPPQDLPRPVFDGYDQAIAWSFAEQENLTAVCTAAFAEGRDKTCWQLAFALRGFLFIAKDWDRWIETHEAALAAALRAANVRAEAVTRNNLGLAFLGRGDHAAAGLLYEEARTLFHGLGDAHGEHTALAHHAWVLFHQGDLSEAHAESTRALDFVLRHGNPRNKAILQRDTALIEIGLGLYQAAADRLAEAIDLLGRLDLPMDTAMAYNCLGQARRGLGDLAGARDAFLLGVELGRTSGSVFEEARGHQGAGEIAAELSDTADARGHWELALTGYTILRDARRQEEVRARLAGVEA